MSMFGYAYKSFFQNYFNFSGRATRAEFWCVAPVLFILWMIPNAGFVGDVVSRLFPSQPMTWDATAVSTAAMVQDCVNSAFVLAFVFLVIPALSLFVRRMHDAGYSEWRLFACWIMLPLLVGVIPDMLWLHLPYAVERTVTFAYCALVVYGVIMMLRPSRVRGACDAQ